MNKETYNSVINRLAELIKDTEFENVTFCVGGCVRDELLGNEIKDIDIAVNIQDGGILLAEYLFSKRMLKQIPVTYPSYSTAMFVLKDFPNIELEAVQTRKEKYEDKTNRNPTTAFGTIEQDCFRRDLTINSLYKNVSTGEYLDITGKGLDDLKNHIIRTPLHPDETFDDDPLRMLRVIRFASRYGWDISAETIKSIKKNASRLSIITRERVHDELNKMLSTNLAWFAMKQIIDTGLFKFVFNVPEDRLEMWNGWMESPNEPINVYDDIVSYIHGISYVDYTVYLTAMFYAMCCDEQQINNYMKSLKYSTDDIKKVQHLFFVLDKIANEAFYGTEAIDYYNEDGWCRWIKYLCKTEDVYNNVMKLVVACVYPDTNEVIPLLYKSDKNSVDKKFFGYKLPITGNDIMKELDVAPGKDVKLYLELALDFVLREPSLSKEDIIKQLKLHKSESDSIKLFINE